MAFAATDDSGVYDLKRVRLFLQLPFIPDMHDGMACSCSHSSETVISRSAHLSVRWPIRLKGNGARNSGADHINFDTLYIPSCLDPIDSGS